MKLKAYGKINLALDVVRRREDGYHEVRMIMQTVGIFDRIELIEEKEPGIRIRTNLSFVPADENNLAYKAARLLMDEFHVTSGLAILLEKHIPVAAGMAGGSTDAAAVLFGVNKLFKLGLSMQDLMDRGVKIGADVPYCIMRGTALSEGIGEILTPLPPAPQCSLLIAKPGISVSTKYVYENLHANELTWHPDIDGMVTAIQEQNLRGITDRMENVLETVTAIKYPIIEEIKACMREQGAMNALMSGSGPTVFGVYETEADAKRAYDVLAGKNLAKQLFVTGLKNRSE